MDRTAVFVDAGYLFAAGSKLIASEKLVRSELNLDYDAVLKLLGQLVTEITGLPLLRIYWYDGTGAGPTPQQLAIAYKPSVKLRLGFLNSHGQQKGVDSLLVADMINLSRNRAMADILLLTGDEDIRVGVQQAQEFGVRVHLLGISPSRENQSGFLVQEADSVRELSLGEVQSFLRRSSPPTFPATVLTGPTTQHATLSQPQQGALLQVAQQLAAELSLEERRAVLKESSGSSVPQEVDRRLLIAGTQAMGGVQLTPTQKRHLRSAFLDACGEH